MTCFHYPVKLCIDSVWGGLTLTGWWKVSSYLVKLPQVFCIEQKSDWFVIIYFSIEYRFPPAKSWLDTISTYIPHWAHPFRSKHWTGNYERSTQYYSGYPWSHDEKGNYPHADIYLCRPSNPDWFWLNKWALHWQIHRQCLFHWMQYFQGSPLFCTIHLVKNQ